MVGYRLLWPGSLQVLVLAVIYLSCCISAQALDCSRPEADITIESLLLSWSFHGELLVNGHRGVADGASANRLMLLFWNALGSNTVLEKSSLIAVICSGLKFSSMYLGP